MVKHPEVSIALVGEDGNAFSILGRVNREMRRAGIADKYEEFRKEATAGDYNHLLQTVMAWFEVPIPTDEDDEDEYDPNRCGWCDALHYDCECDEDDEDDDL